MKTPRLAALLTAFVLLASAGHSQPNPIAHGNQTNNLSNEMVRIESGWLHGRTTNGISVFLKVPYAAPPVGALRWVAPQPAVPWGGVREATQPGLPAAQGEPGKPGSSTNEDCLYLNITTPALPVQGPPKPVMVWLHGGGFSGGTANAYGARSLVTTGDVIVVAVEFRLNIFGYFGQPSLTNSGTFGLLDQQAALGWVQRNIAAFGGNPTNVTLFGESGGAVAACAQLTSPGAAGLFQKMILQSGAATTSWPTNAANLGPHGSFWRPQKDVERAGQDLEAELACPEATGSRAALEWLRQVPAGQLLAHGREFPAAAYGNPVLPQNPAQALVEGQFNAVPLISGFNRDEGRGLALGMQLLAGGQPLSEAQYQELLFQAFGTNKAAVEYLYPRSQFASPALAWSAIYTDRMFAAPQIIATRAVAKAALAFAYEFADTNAPGFFPFFPGFPPGATHSGELPFLFDFTDKPIDMTGHRVPLTTEQKALGGVMVRHWTRFARDGDPNGPGLTLWPRFDPASLKPELLIFASGPHGVETSSDALERHYSAFWENFPK